MSELLEVIFSMFKFLKEKLKGAVDRFSKKVEEEVPEEKVEEIKDEVTEKVKEKKRVEGKKEEKPAEEKKVEDKPKESKKEVIEKKEEEIKEEKKGFFKRIKETVSTKKISEEKFEELFWDLEIVLLENNVAVEVIDKIKRDLKVDLVDVPIKRSEIEDKINNSLKESISELFKNKFDLIKEIRKSDKPYVIVFLGINGSGKTTTIAKFVKLLKDNGLSSVIAASDTFRAAAIHQLEEYGKKLDVKVIKHDYGADPAAVAFDARKYAESKKVDVVFVDTAGRLHSNVNLMDEVKKIIRVIKPNLKVFVGESITGNDCVQQANKFNESVGIDVMVLSKADVDEKGGAAISVSYVTDKPIVYLGTGQRLEDLKEFNREELIKSLGFEI
jgi:fused signal recognition particle receptor